MSSEWIDFGLVAAAIALLAFLVFLAFARRNEANREVTGDASGEFSADGLFVGLSGTGLLAPSRRDKEEIQPELTRAGFYSRTSLVQYRAIRYLLILLSLITAGLVALIVPPSRIPLVALIGLGLAVIGYSAPRVYVGWRGRWRARQIEQGLPVFADLMTLALLGGQNLLNALRRVAVEIRPAYPVVANELSLVVKQAELNTLPHAFAQWAERCQVAEVRDLVMVLTQAQRMGTDITAALMEFANNLRANMRQRADAQAQRAGLWILFPNLLCLWIPAAVILVAPMAYEFQERRAKAQEALRNSVGGRNTTDIMKGKENRPNRQGFTDSSDNNQLNK
jgi:tight adherence protein C